MPNDSESEILRIIFSASASFFTNQSAPAFSPPSGKRTRRQMTGAGAPGREPLPLPDPPPPGITTPKVISFDLPDQIAGSNSVNICLGWAIGSKSKVYHILLTHPITPWTLTEDEEKSYGVFTISSCQNIQYHYDLFLSCSILF